MAVLLLGVPWEFDVPVVAGWEALLHYPRVFGASLLWALGMSLLWRSDPGAAGTDGRARADAGADARRGAGASA